VGQQERDSRWTKESFAFSTASARRSKPTTQPRAVAGRRRGVHCLSVSRLAERLVAQLGPPSGYDLPAGREDVPLTRTFRGWQLGEPVVAGPHTFTLYVNLNGAVREYEHTVVEGAVDDLHWSPRESLAEMERDLAATAKSQTAMGTAAAPGWSELRDRVAALRAQVESVGGRTP